MSLPLPHVQAISTYKREWRVSSTNRNISNPYNLAIPPKNPRRSARYSTEVRSVAPRTDTRTPDTPTRPPSYRTKSSISLAVSAVSTVRGSDFSEAPPLPKKAVIVTEKPVYPESGSAKAPSLITVHSDLEEDDAPEGPAKKKKVNDRILALGVVLLLVVLLAIAIPLGIILPQKLITPLPVNVLVPFYGEPAEATWNALYETLLRAHENKFIIIVNPDNGPGDAAWPSGIYIKAVENLRRFANVQTVGYINTDNGNRSLSAVSKDIDTYAAWSNYSAKFGLNGIAFDHSPWKLEDMSGDYDSKKYLNRIIEEVKQGQGFGDDPIVVLNPGQVPEEQMDSSRADVTVVYDGTFQDMPNKEKLKGMMGDLQSNRQDHGMFVNGVPQELGRGDLRKIVEDVRKHVEWLYLTNATENPYSDLGSLWPQWTSVIW